MILHGLGIPCANGIVLHGGKPVLSRVSEKLDAILGHAVSRDFYVQEIRLIPEEPVTITLTCRTPFPENKTVTSVRPMRSRSGTVSHLRWNHFPCTAAARRCFHSSF